MPVIRSKRGGEGATARVIKSEIGGSWCIIYTGDAVQGVALAGVVAGRVARRKLFSVPESTRIGGRGRARRRCSSLKKEVRHTREERGWKKRRKGRKKERRHCTRPLRPVGDAHAHDARRRTRVSKKERALSAV